MPINWILGHKPQHLHPFILCFFFFLIEITKCGAILLKSFKGSLKIETVLGQKLIFRGISTKLYNLLLMICITIFCVRINSLEFQSIVFAL